MKCLRTGEHSRKDFLMGKLSVLTSNLFHWFSLISLEWIFLREGAKTFKLDLSINTGTGNYVGFSSHLVTFLYLNYSRLKICKICIRFSAVYVVIGVNY